MSAGAEEDAAGVAEDLGLVDALAQLSFAVYELLGRAAARHQLSVIQLRLLGILRDREPGMAQLAGLLHLDKSSMTGLVDRAERRGLVERVAVPEDGRAVRVVLTPEGRRLGGAVAAEVRLELSSITGVLGEPGRRQLSGLASQLVRRAAVLEGIDLR